MVYRLLTLIILAILGGPAHAARQEQPKGPFSGRWVRADEGYKEVRRWNPMNNPNLSAPVYKAEEGEVIHIPEGAERNGDWVLVPGQSLDGKLRSVWVHAPKSEKHVQPNRYKFKIDSARGTRTATVFSIWGKSYLDCRDAGGKSDKARENSPCIAWPNETADFKILDSMFAEVSNEQNKERNQWQLFYRVEYAYTPDGFAEKRGFGWINAQDLRAASDNDQVVNPKKAPVPFVSASDPEKEHCVPESIGFEGKQSLERIEARVARPTLEDVVESIAPYMGQCALNKKREFPVMKDGLAGFDQTMVPFWQKKKVPGDLAGIDGRALDKKTLFDIDSLARTLYGEMATTCLMRADGGYVKAVAKVIMNRAQSVDSGASDWRDYAEKRTHSVKGTVGMVVGKSRQFSVWNKYHENAPDEWGPNDRLLQVLCPASSRTEKAYMNRAGTADEVLKWRKSLEIAVQAILDPENFGQDTKNVTQYYYTSGLGAKSGYKRVKPRIGGHLIDRGQCIELWEKK